MGLGIGISGGKNKSKSSGSTNNSLDPWSMEQYGAISGQVKNLLGSPATAYTGQLSAGPNALQTQAGDAVKGLLGFTPQQVSSKSLLDTDISKYMNPETQGVIDSALGDIERSRQMQKVTDAQGATAAGAWGGSRHGVAESLTNDNALRTAASTAANLRSQAYNDAVAAAQGDLNRDLSTQQFNSNLGLSGAQLGLSTAGLLGQLGSDLFSQEQGGLDRQYADFLRLDKDPKERAQLLLGLLGSTPMFYDTKTSGKSSGSNIGVSAGYTYGG